MELGVEPLLLHNERSHLMLFGYLANMPPWSPFSRKCFKHVPLAGVLGTDPRLWISGNNWMDRYIILWYSTTHLALAGVLIQTCLLNFIVCLEFQNWLFCNHRMTLEHHKPMALHCNTILCLFFERSFMMLWVIKGDFMVHHSQFRMKLSLEPQTQMGLPCLMLMSLLCAILAAFWE